ncbi:hypothetical protein G5V58_22365 [Nocardioides anomalus]|uniref:Uncharacterized protein n=1 Tax=Nocardioides anomalus TaxID=2712223 RepID=A0A6G6WIH8_9ACTN|nr:hypothetical protein [Nocardioides anomalus]QIG45141.1 hypothetical protein G5V58_22365 [Nocardioides anomalus]
MTATPLAELLAGVPSLNRPDQPFTYSVEGQTIVGTWDIVKATSLYPTEVTHIDRDYRLEVELDEGEHQFDVEDEEHTTRASLDGDGLHAEKSLFKGKEKKKEFSFEFGGVNKTEEGIGVAPVVYSFDTDKIKQPLFGYLEQHGWERKKGFFRRLFS